MPYFCGINIRLVSQPGNITLPEYIDPSAPDKDATCSGRYPMISTHISATRISHFWIVYSIPSPCPLSSYYYFRITLADEVVLSWGCGARDGFQGKVMFALVDDEDCWTGKKTTEKRAFSIAECDKTVSIPEKTIMKIAVYRARGRKRVSPRRFNLQSSDQRMLDVANIQLLKAGSAESIPQKYYKYSLSDPIDHPFAEFMYDNIEKAEYLEEPELNSHDKVDGEANAIGFTANGGSGDLGQTTHGERKEDLDEFRTGTGRKVESVEQIKNGNANERRRCSLAIGASDVQSRKKDNPFKRIAKHSSLWNMRHSMRTSAAQVGQDGVFGERRDRADSNAILRSVVTTALWRKSMEDLGKS